MESFAASGVSVLILMWAGAAFAQDGGAVYQKRCAQCHDEGVARAPQLSAMKLMTPERVLAALTNGKMAEQGKALTAAEARVVSTFVSGKPFGTVEAAGPAIQGLCADSAAAFERPFSGAYWNLLCHSLGRKVSGDLAVCLQETTVLPLPHQLCVRLTQRY